jgi:para-aminobenzoate synthetase / 4-amino-4-deoxychorismate lyase
MKGNAARGRTLSEDRQPARALRNSAKERAENVMIVDLIRNDVARVAEIGGVSVLQLCRVERYETVLQLTSDIVARLRPGTGLREPCRHVCGPASTWPSARRWSTATRAGPYTGVGGGITWRSEAAAEHAEVLAKAAILNRRHQDFELIEIMRYVPERGLRNRDRHLRRMADSAEYHGFRFDLSSITSELGARLAGCGPSRVRLW